MESEDSERLARIEQALKENSEQIKVNSEQIRVNSEQITETSEQIAWMIGWLDGKFSAIDRRFALQDEKIDTLNRELRAHIDLRYESICDDFRAFREVQKAQAERTTKLETRVEAVEHIVRVLTSTVAGLQEGA